MNDKLMWTWTPQGVMLDPLCLQQTGLNTTRRAGKFALTR